MRIGLDLLSERGTPGGIHTYVNRLVEEMARTLGKPGAGYDGWELVIFQHDDFQWLFPIAELPCVSVVSSGRRQLGAMRRRLHQQNQMPSLARRNKVDLVHSFNNVLPLRITTPSVLTVLDLSSFVIPERFGFFKRHFLRWSMPRSVERASRVIAISENTRSEILERMPGTRPEKVRTIPLGVDASFHPGRDADAEKALRARHGLPEDFFFYVGAAEPGKNLLGVTRALEIARDKHDVEAPWVLTGLSGAYHDVLKQRWRNSSVGRQIHSLGVVEAEDLPHFYRMARALVFPSLYEGFGLPLLEALASGTPAITSGGESALGEVAGDSAITVCPEDVNALARELARIWRHREVRDLLRMRGPRRAKHFSWSDSARDTLEVYRELSTEKAAVGADTVPV